MVFVKSIDFELAVGEALSIFVSEINKMSTLPFVLLMSNSTLFLRELMIICAITNFNCTS